jgi:hypothetical protein
MSNQSSGRKSTEQFVFHPMREDGWSAHGCITVSGTPKLFNSVLQLRVNPFQGHNIHGFPRQEPADWTYQPLISTIYHALYLKLQMEFNTKIWESFPEINVAAELLYET